MKVYILYRDSMTCLAPDIEKIFLSKEKAEEYLLTLGYGFYVEEHEVII